MFEQVARRVDKKHKFHTSPKSTWSYSAIDLKSNGGK